MASSHRDYLPQNAAQFNSFAKNLLAYVERNTAGAGGTWPAIPQERVTLLRDSCRQFEEAYNAALFNPTRPLIARRRGAQAAAAAVIRAFVNQFLRFPPVDDTDREAMGIPNHDTVRTSHYVVTEAVSFTLKLRSARELVVDFWVQGAAHKAKPQGYDGAVIIWGIRDTPPAKPEDLEHHAMASKTPFTLHFAEAERGKTVYIGLAWQNARGILGPWSEYERAIVP